MSKQPRNLNAVFGRFRRRMLAAELPTGAVERRDIDNASEPARRTMPATPPDPPRRLPGPGAWWRVRPRRARRRHAPSPRWPLKLRVGPGSASAPARPRDRKEIRRPHAVADAPVRPATARSGGRRPYPARLAIQPSGGVRRGSRLVRGPHSNSERGRPDRRMIAFSVPARNSPWSGTGMVTVPTLPVFCITTWLPRLLTSPKP